jgi:hypothetical protein
VVGRINFALERLDSPRHSSHVAQLFSLGGIERFDFMKTSRLIIWPAILVVAGLFCWLAIQPPQVSPARIRVENDSAQISAARAVSYYDYTYIPQNRTPEISVALH